MEETNSSEPWKLTGDCYVLEASCRSYSSAAKRGLYLDTASKG